MKKLRSHSSDVILNVEHLAKTFPTKSGEFRAVDDISFDIRKGEIVGLLGPNGAGKTTTIQMLLGLMTPTSGSIEYFGLPFEKDRSAILQRVNHTSGYSRMPWRLSVKENLTVFAKLYQVKNVKEKIAELSEQFEATNLLNKKIQDLSAGQMTRCLLMKAFLNDPELVLLDEPTASLDPDISDKIREFLLLQQKTRKMSILITSHNMKEVEEMCDRVIFLNHGKIYAIDTPEGLARRNKLCELQLMVADGLKRLIKMVEKNGYTYTEKKRFINIQLPDNKVGELLSEMGKNGLEYTEIEIVRPSLQDFFLDVSKKPKK